ncbi:hypothetical protein F5880DRAFT_72496 [Lentinula raphanica]|nr:hypothetical protein F5880DRAFT_72496 [Lentinula raphanica]
MFSTLLVPCMSSEIRDGRLGDVLHLLPGPAHPHLPRSCTLLLQWGKLRVILWLSSVYINLTYVLTSSNLDPFPFILYHSVSSFLSSLSSLYSFLVGFLCLFLIFRLQVVCRRRRDS